MVIRLKMSRDKTMMSNSHFQLMRKGQIWCRWGNSTTLNWEQLLYQQTNRGGFCSFPLSFFFFLNTWSPTFLQVIQLRLISKLHSNKNKNALSSCSLCCESHSWAEKKYKIKSRLKLAIVMVKNSMSPSPHEICDECQLHLFSSILLLNLH